MILWKIGFVVDTGADYIKREAIVIADTNSEALSVFNRDYSKKLGYDESIHRASVVKIPFDPDKHGMIYCTK